MALTPDPASPSEHPLSDNLPQGQKPAAVEKPTTKFDLTPEPWCIMPVLSRLDDKTPCTYGMVVSHSDPTHIPNRAASVAEAWRNARLMQTAPRMLRFVHEYVQAFVRIGLVTESLERVNHPQPASYLDEAIAILRELGVRQ